MRDKIHPEYKDVQITCSCGNSFVTRSTSGKKQMTIEICSMCHPFYTGMQKLMDTSGRVDKFKQKYTQKPEVEKVAPISEAKLEAKAKKKEKEKAIKTKAKTSRKIKVTTKPKEKKAAAPKATAHHAKPTKTTATKTAKKSTTKKKAH